MRLKDTSWRKVARLLRALANRHCPRQTGTRTEEPASSTAASSAAALWPWDSCDTCALPIPPA